MFVSLDEELNITSDHSACWGKCRIKIVKKAFNVCSFGPHLADRGFWVVHNDTQPLKLNSLLWFKRRSGYWEFIHTIFLMKIEQPLPLIGCQSLYHRKLAVAFQNL